MDTTETEFAEALNDRIQVERSTPHTAKITAYDFTTPHHTFSFHVMKEQAAEALRRIADKILTGEILVQRAQVTTEARRSGYSESALILEFIEKN